MAGEDFYAEAFRRRLLPDSIIPRLVSLNSMTDSKAGKEWLGGGRRVPTQRVLLYRSTRR